MDGKEKFSENFIINKISDYIVKMVLDGNSQKVAHYLDEMIDELDAFSLKQELLISLVGFEKPAGEIQIGNVTIKWIDAARTEELIKRVSSAPDQIELINNYIKEHVCAEFHCVAEPNLALEQAEEETRRAIDLIRYSIPALYPYDVSRSVAVGLHGEVCYGYRFVPIDSNGAMSFASSRKSTGPLFEFEFTPENIQKMKEIGVFKLSEILKKDEISEFGQG